MNRILDRLLKNAAAGPLRPAIVWREGERERALCWRDFTAAVLSLRVWLRRTGRGRPMFLLAPNSLEWVLVHVACLCGDGLVVALDAALPPAELALQMEKVGEGALLFAESLRPTAERLRALVPGDASVSLGGEDFRLAAHPGAAEPAAAEPFPAADEDAVAMVLFTSGTTAGSKGVALTRRNLLAILGPGDHVTGYSERDRTALLLPLHHAFGCVTQIYLPLYNGGAVCLLAGYKRLSRQLRELSVTILCLVPALARGLLEELDALPPGPGSASQRLLPALRLCYCGGAALAPELLDGLLGHGFPVVEGYGATECTALAAFSLPEERRRGTVGRVYPGCHVRIADDGEIQIRGESVMAGYWNDPDATRGVLSGDGWFCTGDVGSLSGDGYLTVLGRKKNLILTENGKKVFPEELEAQLEALPPLREALVYAEGNRLCARVYAPDEAAARQALDEWNRAQPDWRRLGAVAFSAGPLPRTNSGKLQRRPL